MDVYRQASDIIRIVREGHGTAKALCLRKEMQKKKQTYAVVCETLRHYELLEDVLENAEFFKYYPNTNHEFALCMCYDVVLGKGVNTKNDTTARAIMEATAYLREAYWQVHKHHTIPPRSNEKFDENEDPNAQGTSSSPSTNKATSAVSSAFPRYARVNTLKIAKDTLIERLHRAAETRKERERQPAADKPDSSAQSGKSKSRKGFKVLPEFTEDPVVPDLLVFPPGTDLHAHPAVRSGQLILQDRASCLPACVLLDAVPVTRSFEPKADEKALEYVVDACAAPGNKTTQLAALGGPHGVKIMATERNENRATILERRVQSLGASEYINVVNMDFFQLSSDDRSATEAILLDPSCSASGVVTRVDVALMRDKSKPTPAAAAAAVEYEEDGADGETATGLAAAGNEAVNPEDQGNAFSRNVDRVAKLAHLQRKLLAHALLSFDNCRTVVYSTCSVHEAENEDVVRLVMDDERVKARGWTLSNIMPFTGTAKAGEKRKRAEEGSEGWATRGIQKEEDAHPIHYTIRCDPVTDRTNGFFVARFDRSL